MKYLFIIQHNFDSLYYEYAGGVMFFAQVLFLPFFIVFIGNFINSVCWIFLPIPFNYGQLLNKLPYK